MVVIAARIGGEEIPPKPDSKADNTEEFLATFVQSAADRAYGLEHPCSAESHIYAQRVFRPSRSEIESDDTMLE